MIWEAASSSGLGPSGVSEQSPYREAGNLLQIVLQRCTLKKAKLYIL